MAEQARLEAVVYGFVQGVSFRYYTVREAARLDVTGGVRNRWDGTVEVVAEGDRSRLEELLAWLGHGPGAAEVERVDARWTEPAGEFSRFEVRR